MKRSMYARLRILPVIVLVAGLTSCGALEGIKLPLVSRQAATDAQQRVELPTIVAVMPFANATQQKDAAERMRKSFYNAFSSTSYVDVELTDVDEGIVRLERSAGKNAANMKPQEVCQAIGCDGLLFGKVTDYQKIFGGVYSRLRAEA
ncbi:MAG: tetratricopeptide repeat protein, partial [Proteobacteria bacterium]|nr:tetratricopeptide repeat protein [Pseudomonadota bacterium]